MEMTEEMTEWLDYLKDDNMTLDMISDQWEAEKSMEWFTELDDDQREYIIQKTDKAISGE